MEFPSYKPTFIYAVYVCICIYIIGISGSSSGVRRTLGVTKAGSASSVPRHSAARRHGRVAPMGGEPPKVWGKRYLGWSQHVGVSEKHRKTRCKIKGYIWIYDII
jgi:hypothetical protein